MHQAPFCDMVSHMKTTIHISDALFRQAKNLAQREGTTFREVVETALRRFLETQKPRKERHRLRRHSFRGKGLRPGVSPDRWRELAHEGRGG